MELQRIGADSQLLMQLIGGEPQPLILSEQEEVQCSKLVALYEEEPELIEKVREIASAIIALAPGNLQKQQIVLEKSYLESERALIVKLSDNKRLALDNARRAEETRAIVLRTAEDRESANATIVAHQLAMRISGFNALAAGEAVIENAQNEVEASRSEVAAATATIEKGNDELAAAEKRLKEVNIQNSNLSGRL
jgi:hypothetical protein